MLARNESSQSAFPASLIEQVFLLSSSDPYPETPALIGEDYYVFAFKERQTPEAGDTEDLETYRQTLLKNKQQELLVAYLSNLEKKAEITRHKSL
jgi:hypothetical protein